MELHTGQYLHTGHTPTLVQGDRQGHEALGRAFISAGSLPDAQ